VQELTAKLEAESTVSRAEWEQKQAQEKQVREEERAAFVKRSWIIRILVNFTLIRLVHGFTTYPLPFAQEWPLSMLTDEEGRLKCSFLMVAGNLLFHF
jgi:uncharacterized ion transporter superfamily protein YfcC